MRRLSKLLHGALWLALAVCAAALETLRLKLALAAVALAVALALLALFGPHRRWLRWVGWAALAASVAGALALLPPRRAPREGRVRAVVLDEAGEEQPMPWLPYLANLVPESDVMRVATLLQGHFPWAPRGKLLDELREHSAWDNVFVREYRVLRERGLDAQVPSALPLQLFQQAGQHRRLRHHVVVLPEGARGPVPLVVFLHGYLGNFQFYGSYLSELRGCAVVLPSTQGLRGVWTEADLDFLVRAVLPSVERLVPVDRARMHLVGLSNGGTGVNAALQGRPQAFATATYLSAWVAPGLSASATPVGLVYGERDSIAANNHQQAQALRAQGRPVREVPFEGERHFVMLTRRREVQAALAEVAGLPQ